MHSSQASPFPIPNGQSSTCSEQYSNVWTGSVSIPEGAILLDRYRVLSILGQGGFGRTYLAEDLQRFNESCVLKEFAPQVQGDSNLAKAYDLFEREAGVLYRLNHDQIPCFRELCQPLYRGQPYLLLVQDFVGGWTYRELLEHRQQYGKTLSEAEVALMLKQLLPVLGYLHGRGVIHRDISPDNLIQRDRDGLPILIDFGAVKQVTVTLLNALSAPSSQNTCLGKLGYAPPEQMQQGSVLPHSDIYALGATALTLLSGEEPQSLMDPTTLDWVWNQVIHLSPDFGAIIKRMVALRPRDRYPSAQAALQDLQRLGNLPSQPAPSLRGAPIRQQVAPTQADPNASLMSQALPATGQSLPPTALPLGSPDIALQQTSSIPPPVLSSKKAGSNLVWSSLGLLLAGLASLAAGVWWQERSRPSEIVMGEPQNQGESLQPHTLTATVPAVPAAPAPPSLSPAELSRQAQIEQQRQTLGISAPFFSQLISEEFHRRHPTLGDRPLTPAASDTALREDRLALSEHWLSQLTQLSSDQRSRLGSYSANAFETWLQQAEAHLVSRSEFRNHLEQQRSQQFPDLATWSLDSPQAEASLQQLDWAIASQLIQTIQSHSELISLTVDAAGNAYRRGPIQPQQHQIFQIQLHQGQRLRISLEAQESVQLALYPPSGSTPLVPRLSDQYWEGRVPQTGLYRLGLSSQASGAVEYGLNLIVE